MFTAAWNRKCKKKAKIVFTVRETIHAFARWPTRQLDRKMKTCLKGTVRVNLSDSPCNDGKVFFTKVSVKPLTDYLSNGFELP